jgi:nitrite reductase (NADH) small subunit
VSGTTAAGAVPGPAGAGPAGAGATATGRWVDVCRYTDLLPERGACALVDGRQVAIFRGHDGALYALANRDPFSGAYVLARGIVGTRDGAPTVASPMYKQVFDLRTGRCLDDSAQAVATYRIRRNGTRVEVAVR